MPRTTLSKTKRNPNAEVPFLAVKKEIRRLEMLVKLDYGYNFQMFKNMDKLFNLCGEGLCRDCIGFLDKYKGMTQGRKPRDFDIKDLSFYSFKTKKRECLCWVCDR